MIRPPFVNPRTHDLRIAAGQSFIFRMVLFENGLPLDFTGQPFALRIRKRGAPEWAAGRFTGIELADGNIVDVRVPGTSTIELTESALEYEYVKLVRDGMDFYPRARFQADYSGPLMVAPEGTSGSAPLIVATVDVALATITWDSPVSSGASLNAFATKASVDAFKDTTTARFVMVDQKIAALEAGVGSSLVGTMAELFELDPAAFAGQLATVTDFGPYSQWAAGTAWGPLGDIVFAGGAYPPAVATNTFPSDIGPSTTVVGAETKILTVPIPPLVMGLSRSIEITGLLSVTPTPGDKTFRVRHNGSAANGLSGPIHFAAALNDATKKMLAFRVTITNAGQADIQFSTPSDVSSSGGWTATEPLGTGPTPAHLGNVDTTKLSYLHFAFSQTQAGKGGLARWSTRLRA